MKNKTSISIPMQFDNYETITEIGSGGYATVIIARHVKTQELFACKVLERKRFEDSHVMERLECELRVLERISHPNIAKVYKICYLKDFIIIVMEYCPNGTLLDLLINYSRITEGEAKKYIIDILEAISYLHSKGISHRDIKLDNIVISRDFHAKIVDFGMGTFDDANSTLCGTLEYIPPEVIKRKIYDPKKGDMWSFGVCAYTILSGDLPWKGKVADRKKQILTAQYEIPDSISENMKMVIRKALVFNPEERAEAQSILDELQKRRSKLLPELQKKGKAYPKSAIITWKPRVFQISVPFKNISTRRTILA